MRGLIVVFCMGSVLGAPVMPARAQQVQAKSAPALRQMQILKVKELGLEIWVENQPEWEAQLNSSTGHPTLYASSPVGYHPATVMMYTAFPKEKVRSDLMREMALGAIRRASQNFGLSESHSRAIFPAAASYGELKGYEASFAGVQNGMTLDVKMFVGQKDGKYPVVLTLYTQEGKMGNLSEQIRRGWGKLKYLN